LINKFHGRLALAALALCFGQALAQQPTPQQASAIKSACRGDYMSVCSSVPTGGMAALQCLQQHSGQVSAGCQSALAAVTPGSSQMPQAGPSAPPAAMPVPRPLPTPGPMPPRAELRLLRADCGVDYQRYCSWVQPGGGRAIGCLVSHGPQLQPVCRSALRAAAARFR
jgi:hypothetical protein